jgi:hypothetical protein
VCATRLRYAPRSADDSTDVDFEDLRSTTRKGRETAAKEGPMEYLLLIFENEKGWEAKPEAEKGAIYGEYMAFTEDIRKNGKYKDGRPLQPTATATTVRVKNGKPLTTDGPFAETKEQLGGFYLVEAKDLDEAISLAARIPSARWGSIEVRPVMKM